MGHMIPIETSHKTEILDITHEIQTYLTKAQMLEGILFIYIPHTTAAVTINEFADPNVAKDILMEINKIVPWNSAYQHREGNSPAHIKSSLFGVSEMVSVENGKLVLGTWQGIFFCEFDGPRKRKFYLKFIPSK